MDSTDVTDALKKKGFRETSRRDEEEYQYPNTLVRTHVSMGGKHSLSPWLLKAMATQMHLSKKQFEEFVACSFTGDHYRKLLISENWLSQEPPKNEAEAGTKKGGKVSRKHNRNDRKRR